MTLTDFVTLGIIGVLLMVLAVLDDWRVRPNIDGYRFP